MGFLAEEAYEISRPLRASGDIGSVKALLKHLDATYEDPDRKATAVRELRILRRGNSDFTSYYAKFQSILAVLGWEGDTKRSALTQSLSQEIKQVLSKTLPSPGETFDQFFAKVKLQDDQMRRYAAEFKGNKTPQAPSTKPRPLAGAAADFAAGTATENAASSTVGTPFVTAPATPTSTDASGPGKA